MFNPYDNIEEALTNATNDAYVRYIDKEGNVFKIEFLYSNQIAKELDALTEHEIIRVTGINKEEIYD